MREHPNIKHLSPDCPSTSDRSDQDLSVLRRWSSASASLWLCLLKRLLSSESLAFLRQHLLGRDVMGLGYGTRPELDHLSLQTTATFMICCPP